MSDVVRGSDLVPVPPSVARLPLDPKRGIPVPYFVAWIDGQPDFRVADKLAEAIKFDLCWLCGQHRGRWGTFVIGPMCAINRTTAEPPCHQDCAEWAAQVCPFLARPHARRRENNMPAGHYPPGGVSIRRNPGVTLLWTTRSWKLISDGKGGRLFELGDPGSVQWWAEGRTATRAEVDTSIGTGLPILAAAAETGGQADLADLAQRVRDNERWLPVDDRIQALDAMATSSTAHQAAAIEP